MIQQRIINSSNTEIYTNGGGETWITESKVTVFHNFWKTKILTPSESIEDFREVTASEKAQLEKIRDEWVRPPRLLIDIFKEAGEIRWYGNQSINYIHERVTDYNENTGYFEANGILDITAKEAIQMLKYRTNTPNACTTFRWATELRTNLPLVGQAANMPQESYTIYEKMFNSVKNLEVANVQIKNIPSGMSLMAPSANDVVIFRDCPKLRKIIGGICIWNSKNKTNSFFSTLPELKEVQIAQIPEGCTLDLTSCPKINYESYKYIIANDYSFGRGASVKVHASTYAALTGEAESYPFNGGTQEQWMQLLEDAAAKQITFASA